MRVGVPRALLYHRYGQFWHKFLTELGADVVVSRRTDKALLADGLAVVPSEVCIPIKIAAGHIRDLADKTDAIFFPRLMWLQDKLYACPKMIGVVDIARMVLGPSRRVIAPVIKGNLLSAHFRAGVAISGSPVRTAMALARARRFLPRQEALPDYPAGERRIGLISHFYNLEDDFISGAVTATLREHGYRICTKDELPQRLLASRDGLAGNIRWAYERELYNAFRFLLPRVDGICLLVSMGCGPDSLVAEFMRKEATERDVPFLELVIDEHTGTAGLVTRIEAFLELTERRQALSRPN